MQPCDKDDYTILLFVFCAAMLIWKKSPELSLIQYKYCTAMSGLLYHFRYCTLSHVQQNPSKPKKKKTPLSGCWMLESMIISSWLEVMRLHKDISYHKKKAGSFKFSAKTLYKSCGKVSPWWKYPIILHDLTQVYMFRDHVWGLPKQWQALGKNPKSWDAWLYCLQVVSGSEKIYGKVS